MEVIFREIILWASGKLHKKRGLFGFVAAEFILVLVLHPYIAELISDYIPGPEKSFFTLLFELALYTTAILTTLYFWLMYRRPPKFKDIESGVLFAPHGDKKSSQIIDALKGRLLNELKDYSSHGIVIKTLPPHFRTTSKEEAHRIRIQSNSAVVVWGYMEHGTRKGKKTNEFPRVHFTYGHPAMPTQAAIQLGVSISPGLGGRQWSIRAGESLQDIEVFSHNIKEIALFIIGITTYIQAIRSQDIVLLRRSKSIIRHVVGLTNKWTKRNQQIKYHSLFKARVAAVSRDISIEIANLLMKKLVADQTVDATPLLAEAETEITSALAERVNYMPTHLAAAIVYLFKNNLIKSRKHIELAKLHAPNEPAPHLSAAFLSLCEENFPNAVAEYRLGLIKGPSTTLLFEVIDFIEHYRERCPDMPQLHFALGLLNHFIGNDIATTDFISFNFATKNQSKYEFLRQETLKILNDDDWIDRDP